MGDDDLFKLEEIKLKKTLEIIDNQIDVAKEKLNQQANTIIGYTEGLRGT